MGDRYSYSKVGAYESCPLSYDLQYTRKIRISKEYSYDVTKGIIFHKYAEVYRGNSREAMSLAFATKEVPPKHIALITSEQHESIQRAFKAFDWFYDNHLSAKEKYASREYNITDATSKGKAFTGFLDLLVAEPGNYWVIDYKTAKNADASIYSSQLYTYVYFISKLHNVPVDQIHAAVFFPFANVPTNEDRFKKIRITPAKLAGQIDKLDALIEEIESPNKSVAPKLQWLCNYCSYRGIQELCPTSVVAGAKPVRHFNESTGLVS